jgi:hypothetical protein
MILREREITPAEVEDPVLRVRKLAAEDAPLKRAAAIFPRFLAQDGRRDMRSYVCALSMLFLIVSFSTIAQGTRNTSSVSLKNPQLPFVYLIFDHIGPGVPEFDGEPPTRIWLRLVNNSSLPMEVWAQHIPDGRPSGEIGVADDIGRPRGALICGLIATQPDVPPVGKLIDPGETPPKKQEQKSEKTPLETSPPGCADEPPTGYLDIPEYPLSKVVIASGKDVLFSLPVNHIALSGYWYAEIPFWFPSMPSDTRALGDSELGGEISNVVQYGIENIPKEHRDEFERAYSTGRR